jgi:hypothetical protein
VPDFGDPLSDQWSERRIEGEVCAFLYLTDASVPRVRRTVGAFDPDPMRRGGVAGGSTLSRFREAGRPGLDGRTGRFRTRIISLSPKAAESQFLGYADV